MSFRTKDLLLVVLFLALVFAFMAIRPDALYHLGYLNKDEGMLLSVTDRLLHGKKLYEDAFCPYGPVPLYWYAAWSRFVGNSPVSYLMCTSLVYALSFWVSLQLLRKHCHRRSTFIFGAVIFGSLLWRLWVSSRIYVSFEMAMLLLIAWLWKPPQERSIRYYLQLGLLAGFLHWIKFGGGVLAGAALVAADLGWILFSNPRPRLIRHFVNWWPLVAGFAGVEAIRAGWFYLTLPWPICKDVLFPSYMVAHYKTYGVNDAKHTFDGWSLFFNYQLPILAGFAVCLIGIIRVANDRRRNVSSSLTAAIGPALFLLAFYVLGIVLYFKHKWLVYQYLWLLVLPLTVFLELFGARLFVFSAAAFLMLSISVPYKFAGKKKGERVVFPSGSFLYLEPQEKTAWEGLLQALKTLPNEGRRVVLLHHGSGIYHFARIENPTRHSWYLPEWIRPYEEETVMQQVLSADGVAFRNLEESKRDYTSPTAWQDMAWSHLPDASKEKIKQGFVFHANIKDKWIVLAPKRFERK